MFLSVLAIIIGYGIGSVPVAWLAGRALGVDLRERGSGNTGASNVFQSASRMLVVPVGVAQIAQGLLPVLLARALDRGDGVAMASGVAAVAAGDWNPWLGFRGSRGVGATIGVLLATSWVALAVFTVISLAGVAARAIPQGVALAMLATPVAAAAAGGGAAVVIGCAALAALVFAKRLTGNGMPDASSERPRVWALRLVYDRDIADRDAWVRRGIEAP
jgi:glycerol-3-phosphate acyltransferase PlsY